MSAQTYRDEIDFPAYMEKTNLTMGFAHRASEQSVVSILLNFPAALEECHILTGEHFSSDLMRLIFEEIRKQQKAYDVVTIAQALGESVDITELHKISTYNDHSPRGITRHVSDLIDAHKSRKLFQLGELAQELALEKTPVNERVDKVSAALMALEDQEDFGEWIDAHESAITHLALIEKREAGESTGMATGLHDLDEMLDGGLQRGNMVVIGARPAMGKSALGLTIGLDMARTHCVGFISMEMSRSDVSDRQAAILGAVSISSIKRPSRGLQYDRIVEAVEKSRQRQFFVVEQGGLNIAQVKAKAKALKRRKGLDVLIIDYIGLMSGMDNKVSRAYQIEEISRGLKTMAKDLDIVVICLAQVNRGAADKGNQPPSLHELRDSGAIEQDADVVAFIHRPIQAQPELGEAFAGYGLLRVAKNRQGRCGDVHMFYVAEQTRFGQWSGQIPTKPTAARGKFE
jgi:replicative DNA helicase